MIFLPILLAGQAVAQGVTHTVTVLDDNPDQRTLNTIPRLGPNDVVTTFTLQPSGMDINSQTKWVAHTGLSALTTVTRELDIPPRSSSTTTPFGTATHSFAWIHGPHMEVVTVFDADGKPRTVTRADYGTTHITVHPSIKSDGSTMLVSTLPETTDLTTVTNTHTSPTLVETATLTNTHTRPPTVETATVTQIHTRLPADDVVFVTATQYHPNHRQQADGVGVAHFKDHHKHLFHGHRLISTMHLRLLYILALLILGLLLLGACLKCIVWRLGRRERRRGEKNPAVLGGGQEVIGGGSQVISNPSGGAGGAGGSSGGAVGVGSGAGGAGGAGSAPDGSQVISTSSGTAPDDSRGTMRRSAEEGRARGVHFGENPNETVVTTSTTEPNRVDGTTEMRTGFDIGSLRGRKGH